MRFAGGLVIGLIVGAAAGAGGMYWYTQRQPAIAPSPPEVGPVGPTGPQKGKKPRKSPRAATAGAEEPGDEPIPTVTEADLRPSSEGDALKVGAATMDMAGGAEPRDLTQEEIDETIARRSQAIIGCITQARGNAPVNGRVVAGVVVGGDGRVLKSRIEAPTYLLRHGLGSCARRELSALRFPASGSEKVVTVPFVVDE